MPPPWGDEVMENSASPTPGTDEHRALAGDVLKGLFAARAHHAEGLHVRRVDADICHNANFWNQRVYYRIVAASQSS